MTPDEAKQKLADIIRITIGPRRDAITDAIDALILARLAEKPAPAPEPVREVPPAPARFKHREPPEYRLPKKGEWFIPETWNTKAEIACADFEKSARWILDPLPPVKGDGLRLDGGFLHGRPC